VQEGSGLLPLEGVLAVSMLAAAAGVTPWPHTASVPPESGGLG